MILYLLCYKETNINSVQRRRRWGGRGGGRAPPSFGISVNPIRTKGDRLCPPYYYWPPHLFGRCAVSGSYMNLAIKKENGNTKKIKNISLNTFFKICNTFRQQKRVDSFRRKEGNIIFGQNAAISANVALYLSFANCLKF